MSSSHSYRQQNPPSPPNQSHNHAYPTPQNLPRFIKIAYSLPQLKYYYSLLDQGLNPTQFSPHGDPAFFHHRKFCITSTVSQAPAVALAACTLLCMNFACMSRTICAWVLVSALGPYVATVGLYSVEVSILLESGYYGTVIAAGFTVLVLVSLWYQYLQGFVWERHTLCVQETGNRPMVSFIAVFSKFCSSPHELVYDCSSPQSNTPIPFISASSESNLPCLQKKTCLKPFGPSL